MIPINQLHQLVQAEAGKQCLLCVEYLRLKPKRGLVARYTTPTRDQSWTVFVDDASPGVKISIVPFPIDAGIPVLADAVEAKPDGPIANLLLETFREATGDQNVMISRVDVTICRYKPNERCVLKYEISGHDATGRERAIEVYAKLFANALDANRMYTLGRFLYHANLPVALPLAVSAQGIVVSHSAGKESDLTIGNDKSRVQTRDGESVLVNENASPIALQNTGQMLAWMHNLHLDIDSGLIAALGSDRCPRDADHEKSAPLAKLVLQTRNRADSLMQAHPKLADTISRVLDQLTNALHAFVCPQETLVHGAFKPTQLVFVDEQPFVLDFDGARCGDPAVDVGYLFAYLRSSRYWSQKNFSQDFYRHVQQVNASTDPLATTSEHNCLEHRKHQVASAYLRSRNLSDPTLMQRAGLVEAAILFKRAARRLHRLQAPRTHEVTAMLTDAQSCIVRATEILDPVGPYGPVA